MVFPVTVGRVLWYYPGKFDGIAHTPGEPLAAVVCRVFSDRMVNVRVIDQNGDAHARTSVALVQDGDAFNPDNAHCKWMPYQKQKMAEESSAK